jgi:Zn-dependent protease
LRELAREPARWALTIARVRGVPIRLHIFFPLFAFIVLARVLMAPTANPLGGDFVFALTGVAALIVAVIIHELGHVAMTWFVVGETDEIIMWPLGGLTEPVTPTQALRTKEFAVAASGPALNLLVCAVLTPILILLIGEWRDLASNMLDPAAAYSVWAVGGKPTWWIMALWWLNYASAVVAVFNLVPMLPLDGATMLESAVRTRVGRERAVEIVTVIGYTTAALFALMAIVAGATFAFAVALFGALCTHRRSRQIAFLAGHRANWSDHVEGECEEARSAGGAIDTTIDDEFHAGHAHPDDFASASFESEIDRILDKIHREGMIALTNAERAILEKASTRKRG